MSERVPLDAVVADLVSDCDFQAATPKLPPDRVVSYSSRLRGLPDERQWLIAAQLLGLGKRLTLELGRTAEPLVNQLAELITPLLRHLRAAQLRDGQSDDEARKAARAVGFVAPPSAPQKVTDGKPVTSTLDLLFARKQRR